MVCIWYYGLGAGADWVLLGKKELGGLFFVLMADEVVGERSFLLSSRTLS